MTSKNNQFDAAAWAQRLQIARGHLHTMVNELAALCRLRGSGGDDDLRADWYRELVLATVHAQEAFQRVEATFEADRWHADNDVS
jgi:hypothetical protein